MPNNIGLVNLLSIARGQVRIGKSPNLCYVESINWKKLGVEKNVTTYLIASQDKCGKCPSACKGACWNATHCQQNLSNDHCHKECWGCYKNYSARHCIVCRNYDDNGLCVKSCPPDKLDSSYLHVTGDWYCFA
ncbi:insulin receptor-like [Diabrotica virgifera virgifera]|uniref:Furin-like cysteine-rich domain-containing protein n=1 Tax=Diabrotica virgifera virgifera TaxID=50390 RepID=A0ABM5JZN8_DIAVI|nr:insulin receptor-like [Diabrotica virgifera virgifera]